MFQVKNPKEILPSFESVANLARLILAPRLSMPGAEAGKEIRVAKAIKKDQVVANSFMNHHV